MSCSRVFNSAFVEGHVAYAKAETPVSVWFTRFTWFGPWGCFGMRCSSPLGPSAWNAACAAITTTVGPRFTGPRFTGTLIYREDFFPPIFFWKIFEFSPVGKLAFAIR